jgi:hypothetical protein
MTSQQIILLHCVALILLGIALYFTRATFLRVVGAAVAGVAVGLVNAGMDVLAYFMGWWYYPMVDTPHGSPWLYTATAIVYGAALALVGWRVTRRFGGPGLVALLAFMGVFGPARDYAAAAANPWLIVFGPGLIPALGDSACWVVLTGLGQLVMRLVSGPARSDRLAQRQTPAAS